AAGGRLTRIVTHGGSRVCLPGKCDVESFDLPIGRGARAADEKPMLPRPLGTGAPSAALDCSAPAHSVAHFPLRSSTASAGCLRKRRELVEWRFPKSRRDCGTLGAFAAIVYSGSSSSFDLMPLERSMMRRVVIAGLLL